MTIETQTEAAPDRVRPAGKPIRVLAWVLALGSIAFAVVNVVFEMTGRFEEGPLSQYATGLAIVNWFVAALKVLAAGVAVLSVAKHAWINARLVNVLIWAAAGILGVYSLGNIVQVVGLLADPASSGQVDVAGIVYVVGFLLAAAGFAVVAVSHSRRSGLGVGPAILGAVGGVVLLGVILVALPALLTALGIMPSG
jgi:uncharacterized membrane protein